VGSWQISPDNKQTKPANKVVKDLKGRQGIYGRCSTSSLQGKREATQSWQMKDIDSFEGKL
jgi:hypothetical protein